MTPEILERKCSRALKKPAYLLSLCNENESSSISASLEEGVSILHLCFVMRSSLINCSDWRGICC